MIELDSELGIEDGRIVNDSLSRKGEQGASAPVRNPKRQGAHAPRSPGTDLPGQTLRPRDQRDRRRIFMTRDIRRRIVREATPEEKERHRTIRAEIEQELPDLKQWARETAARHRERVAVGTVFTAREADVLQAMDDYATKHSLSGRSAVVREALAQLLGVDITR
jgi:hypothetical protein